MKRKLYGIFAGCFYIRLTKAEAVRVAKDAVLNGAYSAEIRSMDDTEHAGEIGHDTFRECSQFVALYKPKTIAVKVK